MRKRYFCAWSYFAYLQQICHVIYERNPDTTEYKVYCMFIHGQTTIVIIKGPCVRPSGIFIVSTAESRGTAAPPAGGSAVIQKCFYPKNKYMKLSGKTC